MYLSSHQKVICFLFVFLFCLIFFLLKKYNKVDLLCFQEEYWTKTAINSLSGGSMRDGDKHK